MGQEGAGIIGGERADMGQKRAGMVWVRRGLIYAGIGGANIDWEGQI